MSYTWLTDYTPIRPPHFLYYYFSKMGIFRVPSFNPGARVQRYALVDFFVRNSISNNFQNNFYLKLFFFYVMCMVGRVEPWTEFTFPFLYIIIFQRLEFFEPPSSTPTRDRHMSSETFCTKFNFKQLLFKAFFDANRIFGSIEPQNESTFPFLHGIVVEEW